MKITVDRGSKEKAFDSIYIGDVFRFAKEYYMKIPSVTTLSGDKEINSVSLHDGRLSCFHNEDEVIKMTSELIVREAVD